MKEKRAVQGCTGKKRHRKVKEAEAARDKLQEQFPQWHFAVYQCWCCNRWHVGRHHWKGTNESKEADQES